MGLSNTEWMKQAACVGINPDLFHPWNTERQEIAQAIEVCSRCEVRLACLDYAIRYSENAGIWGGMTVRERRREKDRRRRERRAAALNQLEGTA